MAVDIIMRARRRREQLAAEIAKLDAFLEFAAELARENPDSPQVEQLTLRPRRAAATRGVGIETVHAATAIAQQQGPQATRDLVPLVKAKGIPIGGKSEVATLSARLSTSGKGIIEMIGGKWHAIESSSTPVPTSTPEEGEPADPSVAGQSADSLFNQTREGRYAAALA